MVTWSRVTWDYWKSLNDLQPSNTSSSHCRSHIVGIYDMNHDKHMGRIRAIIICGMDVLVIEWTLFCARWDIIGLHIRTKCEKFMDPKRGGG